MYVIHVSTAYAQFGITFKRNVRAMYFQLLARSINAFLFKRLARRPWQSDVDNNSFVFTHHKMKQISFNFMKKTQKKHKNIYVL